MSEYVLIDTPVAPEGKFERFKRFVSRAVKFELFSGLWVVLREMIWGKSHTILYPLEKIELSDRYRSVHRLMRFVESESERCIGCGLCEKICVSNCIAMQTCEGEDGRKKVLEYSINYGRCVYCGLCAEVCPELAIVHGSEYENASEQRAYFGLKNDLLTPIDKLKEQVEFSGFGSLGEEADRFVKKTPTAYKNLDEILREEVYEEILREEEAQNEREVLKPSQDRQDNAQKDEGINLNSDKKSVNLGGLNSDKFLKPDQADALNLRENKKPSLDENLKAAQVGQKSEKDARDV